MNGSIATMATVSLAVVNAGVPAAFAEPASSVRVAQVWSRPALAGDVGVLYATISGAPHAADRLERVSSPVARDAELHESSRVRVIPNVRFRSVPDRVRPVPPMYGMEMHEVTGLDVPAGGRATLSPGRYHVMLIGLRHALVAGEKFPVIFTFEHAGRVAATSTVRL